MTSTEPKLISPWELLRDIASWMPYRDEERAIKIIEHHQRQHATASLNRFFDNRAAAIQTQGAD